jgi:hypothetical protein
MKCPFQHTVRAYTGITGSYVAYGLSTLKAGLDNCNLTLSL